MNSILFGQNKMAQHSEKYFQFGHLHLNRLVAP
jgi:hypothetical protein